MKTIRLYRHRLAWFYGLGGLLLASGSALIGADIEPVLKGAWPEYGPANAKAVVVDRNFAYIAAGEAGLLVFDVADPSHPRPVGRLPLNGSASGVALAGDYAYVSNEGIGDEKNVVFAGLHVIDIREPANPHQVAILETTGRALQVLVSGPHALVADGGYYTDQGYRGTGVEVVDVQDPRAPRRVGRIDAIGQVRKMAAAGDLACVLDEGLWLGGSPSNHLSVIQLSGPGGPHQVGQYRLYDTEPALTLVGNLAYLGSSLALEVFDLADPAQPRKLGEANLEVGLWGSKGIAVAGSNAFVVNAAGVAVIDISNPRMPVQTAWQDLPVTDSGSPVVSGVSLSGQRLFRITERFSSMGREDENSLLEVFDCSDPNFFRRTATYSIGVDVEGLALSGDLALIASGFCGLQIVDVSNPALPRWVSSYSQQSDPDGVIDVAAAGKTVCLLGRRGFNLVDVTDPKQPKGLGQYRLDDTEWSTAGAAAGNRAFLLAHADSGRLGHTFTNFLDVVDISDPLSPRLLLRYNVESWSGGLPTSPRFTYVQDAREGWMILDTSDPANPVAVGSYRAVASVLGSRLSGTRVRTLWGEVFDISDPAQPRELDASSPWADEMTQRAIDRWGQGVVLQGTDAFVAAGSAGLQVYDLSRPLNLRQSVLVDLPPGDAIRDFVVADSYAIGIGYKNIQVLDLADPVRPRRLGSLVTQYYVADFAVSGNIAYLAEGPSIWSAGTGSQLSVVDLSDPTHLRQLGAYAVAGGARSVAVSGHFAFVAAGDRGLQAIDVSNPALMTDAGRYDTSGQATDVVVRGGYAYVADRNAGLQVIDISNPSNLVWASGHATGGWAQKVFFVGNRLFVWDNKAGLLAFDLSDPSSPRLLVRVAEPNTMDGATFVSFYRNYVSLIDAAGLQVLDIGDLKSPLRIGSNPMIENWTTPVFVGGKIYLADGERQLRSIEVQPFFKSLSVGGGQLHLDWEGWGRARLEGSPSLLNPNWQDLEVPETSNHADLLLSTGSAFFRLREP